MIAVTDLIKIVVLLFRLTFVKLLHYISQRESKDNHMVELSICLDELFRDFPVLLMKL